jgi:hypothetical protein
LVAGSAFFESIGVDQPEGIVGRVREDRPVKSIDIIHIVL